MFIVILSISTTDMVRASSKLIKWLCFADFSDANMTYSLVEDKLSPGDNSREIEMSDEDHPDQVWFICWGKLCFLY